MIVGQYPQCRLRRLRQFPWIRDWVTETRLVPQDLIWPLFVREDKGPALIPGMQGVHRLTVEEVGEAAKQAAQWGISALALFPFVSPDHKNPEGKEALNPNNLICRTLQHVKSLNLNIGLIADVALDPYTSHGHDGWLHDNTVDNDATVEILKDQACVQAEAGADIVAPSDMMDGRIGAIRQALDHQGHSSCLIMSYAAKFASHFYGPFRQAVGVETLTGLSDKKTYQMNGANGEEAMREIAQDIQEGADLVIIKPGLPYLDILYRAKQSFSIPLVAYQVSGEYAMLQAASSTGTLDFINVLRESLISLKRAGAQGIFTYGVPELMKAGLGV